MSPADLLFFDAASFLISAAALAAIRRSFNSAQPPAPHAAGMAGLLDDVRAGLRFVWSHPVLRSIFGLLLNINTGSLRQAIVPSYLYGRVISVAGVLAWSAIPLGALAGAAAIRLSGSVADVYAAAGTLTALIALSFAFSPIRRGDRYLTEAASAKAASVAMAEAGPGPAEQ